MRAMVAEHVADIAGRPLAMRDRPVPEPGPEEVRIRVRVCAVCRTDLHVVEGDLPRATHPIIPGHQVVGVVDRVGPEVSTLREGDRAGLAWLFQTCRRCEFCASGRENLCLQARFTGYHVDGGYAEYVVAREAFAYPIPAVFKDEEAGKRRRGYRAQSIGPAGPPWQRIGANHEGRFTPYQWSPRYLEGLRPDDRMWPLIDGKLAVES